MMNSELSHWYSKIILAINLRDNTAPSLHEAPFHISYIITKYDFPFLYFSLSLEKGPVQQMIRLKVILIDTPNLRLYIFPHPPASPIKGKKATVRFQTDIHPLKASARLELNNRIYNLREQILYHPTSLLVNQLPSIQRSRRFRGIK